MKMTVHKPIKRRGEFEKGQTYMKKIKSSDDLSRNCELSIPDIKILLSCNHCKSPQEEHLHQVKKQEVLERNRLCDTGRLFGLSPASSIQHSARVNSARLDSMFESGGVSKNSSKNSSSKKERPKKESLIMGKSPKGYVRENKENFQRNGPTNLQKLRIKLQINKK